MSRREVDTVARKPERRLHEPVPRQPSVLARKRGEPRRQPWNCARRRSDGVVNELGAEGNVQMDQLRVPRLLAQPGHGDEAVEIAGASSGAVEEHGVTTTEQPCHHRLGDTGRQR